MSSRLSVWMQSVLEIFETMSSRLSVCIESGWRYLKLCQPDLRMDATLMETTIVPEKLYLLVVEDWRAGDWAHLRVSGTSRGSASPWSHTPPVRSTSGGEERIPFASSLATAKRSGRCRPQMVLTSNKVGTLWRPRRWQDTPTWWWDTLSLPGWGSVRRSRWCAPCLPWLEQGLRRGLQSTHLYISGRAGWSRGRRWWGWWWGESWGGRRRPGSLPGQGV